MTHLFSSSILRVILAAALIAAIVPGAGALPADSYASRSVLADGRWVSVAVDRSGMVLIPAADLRRWGFDDPASVRVYGYGGQRIPDRLDASTYVDDLPQTPSAVTPRGLVFYASGPESYTTLADGHIVHSLNPFASHGRYFLTDGGDDARLLPPLEGLEPAGTLATTFVANVFHETEEASIGESGHRLFGEDMRHTRTRNLTLAMPGYVEGSEIWVRATLGASLGSRGTLSVGINGDTDPSPAVIQGAPERTYGNITAATRSGIVADGDKIAVRLSLECSGTVAAARLDAIDVNYTRELAMPGGGVLAFTLAAGSARLAAAPADLRVWDVTDPLAIVEMELQRDGSNVAWRSPYGGSRSYIAWSPEATAMMAVTSASAVAPQNLHGALAGDALPDMVIIAPATFRAQAERIAAMHRDDPAEPLSVAVVDAAQVYNEFGSGSADINAIRRLLKMVYDRGAAAGRPLRFALLLGRATHDNRLLTSPMKLLGQVQLPTWQSDESMSYYDSYTSDDILMMLDDGAGARLSSDAYSIAVGRIPAGTADQLSAYVDKMEAYRQMKDDRGWKNRILMVADDGNQGRHMDQSELQAAAFLASDAGSRMTLTKAYIDAFDIVGGEATGARRRQMKALDDGVVWWNFIGHAGTNFLTGDNMLTLTDINSLYLRRLPFFYGATCSFLRWDGAEPSGTEMLAFHPTGGVIAAISATREVYIEQNGYFSEAIGAEAFRRRPDGLTPTIGEFFRAAKNRLASPAGKSNTNKLRYVLLGDPAMRLATPPASVTVASIAGIPADGSADEPPVVMARQKLTVEGAVCGPDGRVLDGFNGFVGLTLYDAEYSTTSLGRTTVNDGEGRQVTFEEQGERLFAGRDSVAGGRFTLAVAMPDQVADNYRPAAMSLYAVGTDGTEATGANRNFYVYGYDATADLDLTPPVIDYAYLNHSSFVPGEAVNPSPMFIARVSDDTGINLSTAGVGRQMSITLDGAVPLDDVVRYYTPSADGSTGGTVAYPLQSLSEGHHELLFRVYDTSGNHAVAKVPFAVSDKLAPRLFEVFTDANPARTEANFFLRHDRPDATLSVTVAVYDLMGRMVWTSTATDRSDMFLSAPLRWDLRDMGGHRVGCGIYVYRATATAADGTPQTVAGRLAVAAM